ncbi:RAD3-like DEAD/DEAH box helicase [Desulfobotulus alkaliphilus]|uniref:RAD3-like DEAD/DEAH box helicase n=1 Tax=Desulfobotulus alkaliphilus TaxID=622671 RepID=A0A562RGY7_9BACT|nr:DEAD/DEAH box helicase [Desulfobotulus alkaliphilus]TWI67784.1 RAD3-like DEAD/DEAH box helicase [Desulfobotulus alkaliphilus]
MNPSHKVPGRTGNKPRFRNRRGPDRKPEGRRMKPGADPRLKPVFAKIGVPEARPFKADPFQEKAIEAVGKGDCLVMAPTGSGKTYIAEQAIEKIFKEGKRAWYASPLKALTNAIHTAFSRKFGEFNVGILTGDRKENPDAPIIIGTTEILRNQLYDAMHTCEDIRCDLVILDEVHYLGDPDRGVVWEETIIYMPPRVPLLMLSATIGNADEIAAWLESIRQQACTIIRAKRRMVPLQPLFFHPAGTLFPFLMEHDEKRPGSKKGLHKKVIQYLSADRPPLLAPPRRLPNMADILAVLRHYNLLPAIFFLKSRSDCDAAITLCDEAGLLADPERAEVLRSRMDELTRYWPHAARHPQRMHIEKRAVAAHHSGHLPAWKMVVETLMSEGLLDAVFATSTVAAGVNFPARTVLVANSDRFNGTEFLPLSSTEFHQMTGRAGRRGKDRIGFAVALPGKFMDLRHFGKMINAPPSEVESQIRIDFSMALNLLLSHTPGMVRDIMDRSFAAFRIASRLTGKGSKKASKGAAELLFADFIRHLNFLKDKNFVNADDRLSEDGMWASQLRIDQPVLVAEGFRLRLFSENNPAVMAGLMASFVNEREADDQEIPSDLIDEKLLKAFLHLRKNLQPFAKDMVARGFPVFPLYLTPAVTVYHWASGMPWEEVHKNSPLAEGDLVRLLLRTSENLRHVGNLGEVFPEASRSAMAAVSAIMREPVTDAYTL